MSTLVILGGGLNKNKLNSWVIERLDYVVNNLKENNQSVICSTSFSLNIPPMQDNDGFIISEASKMFQYLLSKKYVADIYCEQMSHDTIGNVFFSLLLAQELELSKDIKFVTSDFHAPRVEEIAKFISKVVFAKTFSIEIINVKSKAKSKKRTEHEKTMRNKFFLNFGFCKNRKEFIKCFFTTHSNYNHCYSSKKFDYNEMLY